MMGATPPEAGGDARRSLLAWLWGEQGVAGEYLLGSRSVIIGRDPGSDIVLGDPTVSREHARIEHRDGQWWLVPLGTTGRTWINGRRIAAGQRHAVRDGDRLRFGFHTQVQMLVPSASAPLAD
jgi:pSer/pThr/pTyr-binding forkhead associated (FHA) protein